MREKDWQQVVYDAARRLGWLAYHTYDSRRSAPGFPDLVLVRGGRVIFAELKNEKEKPTANQRVWLEALKQTPAEVYVWRPQDWDDVVATLQR